MTRRILRLLYRLHLKKPYMHVDRLRYLKRLNREKRQEDDWYYSDKDAQQYTKGEVLICSRFRDEPVMFLCDPCSHIERHIIRHGLYGAHVLSHATRFIIPGTAVLDVGANIGAYAIPLAMVFEGVEVHAFEPNLEAVSRLKRNILLNKLRNVRIFEVGVGARTETVDLHVFDLQDLGLSSFVKPEKARGAYETLPVPVVTLDDMYKEQGPKISFIKIDVQGYEAEVLAGGRELIRRDMPAIILEHEDHNFHDSDSAQKAKNSLKQFFHENGYEVFYMTRYDPDMLFPVAWERPLYGNLLAVSMNR